MKQESMAIDFTVEPTKPQAEGPGSFMQRSKLSCKMWSRLGHIWSCAIKMKGGTSGSWLSMATAAMASVRQTSSRREEEWRCCSQVPLVALSGAAESGMAVEVKEQNQIKVTDRWRVQTDEQNRQQAEQVRPPKC